MKKLLVKCWWNGKTARSQFHQHFMSGFFAQKCFEQLFCSYSLALYFFGKRILVQKLLVKCWWNGKTCTNILALKNYKAKLHAQKVFGARILAQKMCLNIDEIDTCETVTIELVEFLVWRIMWWGTLGWIETCDEMGLCREICRLCGDGILRLVLV